jgi:hypothetical protein
VFVRILFLIGILSLSLSCDKLDEGVDNMIHANFFSIKAGQVRLYQVKEINYRKEENDSIVFIDSSVYFLKDSIGQFLKNFADSQYSMIRSRSSSSTGDFVYLATQKVQKNQKSFQMIFNDVIENNLVFPIMLNQTWKAFASNVKDSANLGLENRRYTYQAQLSNFNNGYNTFPFAIEIRRFYKRNLIEFFEDSEVYATQYGLVQKTIRLLEKQSGGDDWSAPENGTMIQYNLVAFYEL